MAFQGKLLRKLRKEKHLTQIELGKMVGLSQTMIARYEANANEPSSATLHKFARIFDTSTDYLFGLTTERKPSKGVKRTRKRLTISNWLPLMQGDESGNLVAIDFISPVDPSLTQDNSFAFLIYDEAMYPYAGINSIAFARKDMNPAEGRMVVASYENKIYCRYYHTSKKGNVILLPENPNYMPVWVESSKDFLVYGIVIKIVYEPPVKRF